MLQKTTLQKYFFLAVFIGALLLLAITLKPFAAVLFFGIVAGIVLDPIYTRLLKSFRGRGSLAAIGTITILLFFLITVGTFLGKELVSQSKNVYGTLSENNGAILKEASSAVTLFVENYIPRAEIDFNSYFDKATSWIANHFAGIVSGTANFLFNLFLWFVVIFFVLRDGRQFKDFLTRLSPLNDTHDNKIADQIAASVRSIIRGVFFIALIQGALVGVGFWIVGFENPIFWGAVAAIAAPIPLVGTTVVLLPAILYLLAVSKFFFAILLALWGVLAVGLIDNILAPYLYSKGTDVHSLLFLFSILGGLIVFGPLGFIVGPLIATISISLIGIYEELVLEE